MYYIYSVTNTINGRVYVGQTRVPKERKACHLGGWTSSPLRECVKEQGKDNFSWEVLQIVQSQKAADDCERYYISFFTSTDPKYGYNLMHGGRITSKHNISTLRKISDANKRRDPSLQKMLVTNLLNWRKNNPEKNQGCNNPMYGKHHTLESRLNIKKNHWDNSGKNNGRYKATPQVIVDRCVALWKEGRSVRYISQKALNADSAERVKAILRDNGINPIKRYKTK